MSDYSPEIEEAFPMMPYLRQLYGEEVALGVSTPETYVFYEEGRQLDLGIRVGDPVKAGSISDQAVKAGHRVTKMIPRELFGIPYKGTAIPVLAGDRVVGSIAVGQPVETEENLRQMARK